MIRVVEVAGKVSDLDDASICAAAGDYRGAVFYLGRLHGAPFTNMHEYVGNKRLYSEPPGELRVRDSAEEA